MNPIPPMSAARLKIHLHPSEAYQTHTEGAITCRDAAQKAIPSHLGRPTDVSRPASARGLRGGCLDAVLDITQVQEEKLITEIVVFEVLVFFPVGSDDVMAFCLPSYRAKRRSSSRRWL